MKTHTLLITLSFSFLFLLSCKSQKDVSRSVINEARVESLVTVNDSSQTHLEISHKEEATKQEERLEYSKRTEFDTDNNVVSITETFILLNAKFDFKSQLDQLKREDIKYSAVTLTTDTTSTIVREKEKESTDSRLIQGWEWMFVMIGVAIAILLIVMYLERKVSI